MYIKIQSAKNELLIHEFLKLKTMDYSLFFRTFPIKKHEYTHYYIDCCPPCHRFWMGNLQIRISKETE